MGRGVERHGWGEVNLLYVLSVAEEDRLYQLLQKIGYTHCCGGYLEVERQGIPKLGTWKKQK